MNGYIVMNGKAGAILAIFTVLLSITINMQ